MIALFRYAFLKSWRDQSLIGFLLPPLLVPAVALAGATLGKGWHYPFFMEARYTPEQSAGLAMTIGFATAVIFASVGGFWVFRPEVLTHSIGSLALATRRLRLVAAPILYSATIAFCGWLGSVLLVALLTTAWPPHLGMMLVRLAGGCLGASAAGFMCVTISPQPGMIVSAYLTTMFLMPVIEKSKPLIQLAAGPAMVVVCAAIATVLLERRCAS